MAKRTVRRLHVSTSCSSVCPGAFL